MIEFSRLDLLPYAAALAGTAAGAVIVHPDMLARVPPGTRPIVTALYPRRYGLKNRERLNRLLMLLQLHVNGDDDVHRYATTFRRWLEANGGRPIARRRAIADPLGSPSLR